MNRPPLSHYLLYAAREATIIALPVVSCGCLAVAGGVFMACCAPPLVVLAVAMWLDDLGPQR